MAGNDRARRPGTCGFTVKVKNAQNAGAIGVIVAATSPRRRDGRRRSDHHDSVVRVTTGDGNRSRASSPGDVNVTLRAPAARRRLVPLADGRGRDPAFGGAIRDMWDPTCLGDPGKVTDADTICAADDGGGVHTNSGVPNHGFALLVDGGTFNGQTVTGIGLTKAAHIYWRAQDVYQTPTSNFADHADALEASCTDLIGQNLAG